MQIHSNSPKVSEVDLILHFAIKTFISLAYFKGCFLVEGIEHTFGRLQAQANKRNPRNFNSMYFTTLI